MRLLLYYLVLVVAQGFLAALMAPIPPPDLFLIGVLTLLWRIQPWQLVLVGYGAGFLQDLMGLGNGALGLHAFSLASAALVASMIRAQLTQSGLFERMLVVLTAEAGKWLALLPLLAWLSGTVASVPGALGVAAIESALTVVFGLLLLPWGTALLRRSRMLRKELL